MNKLFLYACSFGKFGTSQGVDKNKWSDNNSFGESLATKLNLELVNRSWAGGSNFHIFRKVMMDITLGNITADDLVLIQYSFINRAYCVDHSKTVMINDSEFDDYYKNFYSDSQSLAMMVSFNQYLKTKLPNMIYSCVDDLQTLENINQIMYSDFVNDPRFFSIKNQSPILYIRSLGSDMYFDCMHLNKKGHETLSEYYYNFINFLS